MGARPLSLAISAGVCMHIALAEPSGGQTDLGSLLQFERASGSPKLWTEATPVEEPSLADIFSDLAASVPTEIWDALPRDLSSNWDTYRTGS